MHKSHFGLTEKNCNLKKIDQIFQEMSPLVNSNWNAFSEGWPKPYSVNPKTFWWLIQTKQSERAKQAHSVLREVEKMGYKNFSPVPV